MFSRVNTRVNLANSSNVLRKRAHKDSLFPRPEEIRIPTASITTADCLLLYAESVRPRTCFFVFLWLKISYEQEAFSWDFLEDRMSSVLSVGRFHHPSSVPFSTWFEECLLLFCFVLLNRKWKRKGEWFLVMHIFVVDKFFWMDFFPPVPTERSAQWCID